MSVISNVFQGNKFCFNTFLLGCGLLLISGCGDGSDSSSPSTVTISSSGLTMPTMIGNQVAIASATISGAGTSEVTTEINTPSYVVTLSNPNPCSLDVNDETSCEFTIESIWDPINLNNSANGAIVTEINSITFLATNNANVQGSPLSTTVTTPYIYISAVANSNADQNSGGAGLQYGAGTEMNPRFESGLGAESDCVKDNMTGLMWSKNANIASKMTWPNAKSYFDLGTAGGPNQVILCGHNDWRLPSVNELASIINYGYVPNPASYLTSQGFIGSEVGGVDSRTNYWSSTVDAGDLDGQAWFISLNSGAVKVQLQGNNYFPWPVRSN